MLATSIFNQSYMEFVDYLGGVGHSAIFTMLILSGSSSTFSLLELFCQVIEKLRTITTKV